MSTVPGASVQRSLDTLLARNGRILTYVDPHITIRHLTEADLDAASDILVAAYDNPASRVVTLRRYLSLQPDGWLLALLDGHPAGMGGAVNYGPFASIGSVGVRPEARRRGIARALMDRLLAWLEAAGRPVAVLVATEGGAPLYTRLGFEEDGATLVFRRDEAAPRPEPRFSARVSVLRADDLPALARFDAPIFGASRPAALASYVADDPRRALVARDGTGAITGYLVAQQQTLGPWAARTSEDAEALLAHALTLPFDGVARAIVPSANGDAARLLHRYGFGEPFPLRHMRRGGVAAPGRPAMLYGLSGFALG